MKPWLNVPVLGYARWVWLLPLLGLGVSAPLWLHWLEPQGMLWLNGLCRGVPAMVWTGFSLMGNAWGLLALTAPLLWRAPRTLWAWLCAAPFAMAFARLGKDLLESPRPAARIDNDLLRIVGEALHNASMPSGHTLTAFSVASAVYFSWSAAQRPRGAWLLWVLAFATGLSRVAVGAHWPGDVAVGLCLGVWAGLLGNALLRRVPSTWCHCRHPALRTVAALITVAAYVLLADPLDFVENQWLQRLLALWALLSVLRFGLLRWWPAPVVVESVGARGVRPLNSDH
jgi:membrane-associated phospholipid phosphatase